MTSTGESTTRGLRPVEPDAPVEKGRETASEVLTRAAAAGARVALESATEVAPRLAVKLGKAIGGVVLAGLACLGGYQITNEEAGPECDRATVEHLLRQATTGARLAEALEQSGDVRGAMAVRDLVDPNQLPTDLRLCVLLSNRGEP
jgi:hypothetical protein